MAFVHSQGKCFEAKFFSKTAYNDSLLFFVPMETKLPGSEPAVIFSDVVEKGPCFQGGSQAKPHHRFLQDTCTTGTNPKKIVNTVIIIVVGVSK